MPPNETERRRALWRFKILNTSKDINFNRIVALAKEHFKASISLISLVNTTQQWFKSEDGMGCSETTRDISFCGHAILQNSDDPFVVPDATLDWRFQNNPLVIDAPYIRFYAGVPLRTADGFNIGTICVIDNEPRDDFSDKERENLKSFAKIVMRELELWVDTLRLRVRNKMQESIAEFSKFCLEAQLANNGGEKKRSSGICDPMMKQLFNKAVQLMRDTLDVDSVHLLEMPCLYSRPVSLSSSGFFLNYPLPDTPTRNLKPLASSGGIELPPEALKSSMNISYFAYLMQTHPQGHIYQNDLPSLPSLFPSDVHSGIVVPIFDNSQNAFGFLIAMTKDSQRQFEEEERVYLSNFGVNVVSEVLKRRVIVADKAKGDFISSISHELRTPLHGILASCELMDESKLNDVQLELIKTIQGCGTSLISIINSVLDFAKLESENHDDTDCPLNQCDPKEPKEPKELETDKTENKSEITRHRSCNGIKKKKGRVDLVKLLEEVAEACYVGQQMVSAVYGNNNKMDDLTNDLNDNIDNDNNELLDVNGTGITQASRKRVYELLHPHQFQHLNKNEDVLLMIDVEPRDAGWFVMAEDGAVKQMLINIIGNSLKFTKEGYVMVSLSEVSYSPLSNQYKRHVGVQDATVPDTSKVHALLTITDTGCGISRSFLDSNIFQPFSQENSLQVGTGLGLSIVKLLVEKMGGELLVESEVGVGTVVRIWLDFDLAPSIVPEVNRGLGCDDFDYNSDDDICVNEAEEKQRQIILERMKQKTVVAKCVKSDKLKEVVVRYFNNWLRVKELICEEDGSDIEGDIVFVIDNIDQLKKMLSKVDSKLTPIVFTTTLAKHGKIAEFVEKIQRDIEEKNINSEGIKRKRRKVVILTRPCGPRKLDRAIASVFSDAEEENVSSKLIKTSTIPDNDQNGNSLNDKINLSSPEQTLTSRNQSSSTTSTPNIVINENDNSSSKPFVPPSRPTLNRSITLPNIPLFSKVNEPKFLPIPKSKRLSPPSPTSILVSLPKSSSSESLNKIKKSKSTISLSNKSGPRVLVVEDNAVNRMILSTFLKKRGIRYEEAENGAIGVEKFRKALEEDIDENSNRKGFDVVLMDIQMPVMNGNVATAEIRKIEKEFKHPRRFSFSSSPTSSTSTQCLTTPEIDIPINDSDTTYSSYINDNTRLVSPDTNDYLTCQKNRLMLRRVSNPDTISFQTSQNNHFSIKKLLKPKMSIQLPKNILEGLSPLPSPIPSSPSFTSTSSRSLIFALTGLASEEDKDNAYESGVDGFLTKPVSLKMLDKVLQKWSERNESSVESSSVVSSSSGGSTD